MGSFSDPGLSPRPKGQNVPNESEKSELNPRKVGTDLHPTVAFYSSINGINTGIYSVGHVLVASHVHVQGHPLANNASEESQLR